MKKIQSFFLSYLGFIRPILVAVLSILAFFIGKGNPSDYWSIPAYVALFLFYLIAELIQHKQNTLSPLKKFKKYLLDFANWQHGGVESPDYYHAAPEYTIRSNNSEHNLDYGQEWTRGEIGAAYSSGNAIYYKDLYFNETLLKQIPVVVFDGGKKTIVAPDWEAIGAGRIYFYLQDSIEYAYHKYLSDIYGQDFSFAINKPGGRGQFNIPVFKDRKELESFLAPLKTSIASMPERDEEKQDHLFYELLDKYAAFREQL